jgi:ribonuclease BN (tRNA processing enzyme)
LARLGFSYADLDYIGLSHFHPDHTADLVPFLFATKYYPAFSRRGPFTILACEGFLDFFNSLQVPYGEWVVPPPGLMEIEEIPRKEGYTLELAGFTLRTTPLSHTAASLAFAVESGGKKIVYSGDTDFDPRLVALAREADLLVLDCSLPDPLKMEGHLIPSEAGVLAAQAGVKRLLLTHFYPECDAMDILATVSRHFGGEVLKANDLMTLIL